MAKTKNHTPDLDNKSRITLGLLNMVQDDARASQRSMANALGIALGLANAYLKRCVNKGLVKVSQAPANRYAYYLTPQGFAEKSRLTAEFLSQSLNLFRHARAEGTEILAHCETRGWNRVALYGLGDLAEIFTLSARDFSVELVVVVDGGAQTTEFAGLPVVTDIPSLDQVDVIIVCDITEPQASFERIRRKFPQDRVLAPQFLGIVRDAPETEGKAR